MCYNIKKEYNGDDKYEKVIFNCNSCSDYRKL